MLRDEFESPGEATPEELVAAYGRVLAGTVDALGVATVVERTDLDRATVEAVGNGEVADLTLEEAAELLGADPDRPDAGTIAAEARDILLIGMSEAVLDVEAVESGIDGRMEAKEIQQKVEGRFPMTLGEYADLHQYIESRKW